MFNWFRPRQQCPVTDHVKQWVDWRMDWLIRQFGRERLTDPEIVLPLADHFPAKYDGSREAVRELFDQVCVYMEIDGEKVELAYYSEQSGQRYALGRGAAGIYDERDERTIIWLETSNVDDPMSVVATFAHELCHMHLLGGKRVSRDELDHEPLTDLAVIFFGFGIFAANSSFSSREYNVGHFHFSSMKRQGYLPPPVLGYGLALYALLREETKPDWARYVRPDVREPMRKAIAHLEPLGVVERLGCEALPPLDPPELSQDLLERLGLRPVDSDEEDAANHAEREGHREDGDRSSDDAFTKATVACNAGQYEAAACLFQRVVELQPDDGEAHGQLALVQLKLNRPTEAIFSASKAIEISPDDAEALQVRGAAYLELGRCQDAVNDLERSLAIDRAEKKPMRFAETAHLLGKARTRQGEHRQAIRDLTLAIREIPTWAAPYETRAEVYERMGELEKAAADREEAARRREAL